MSVGVLLLLIGGFQSLPSLLPGPSEASIRAESERLGWLTAEEGHPIAADIFDRVNDERAERGLRPLAWHDGLADLARSWSEEMIRTGYRHSPAEFRAHPDFLGTAENIFMGPETVSEAHIGWMQSAGHRQAIIDPHLSAIGIGVVCRSDGRMWATQIFGLPQGVQSLSDLEAPEDPIVRREPGLACPSLTPWSR